MQSQVGLQQAAGFGVFGALNNGPGGISSLKDIANADPTQLAKIAQSFAAIPDVIAEQMSQSFALMGSKFVGGTGIRGNDLNELFQNIRGAGRLGNFGGEDTKSAVESFQKDIKDVMGVSERMAELENLQLNAALQTAINTAKIAEFLLKLPQGSLEAKVNQGFLFANNSNLPQTPPTPSAANVAATNNASLPKKDGQTIESVVTALQNVSNTNISGISALTVTLQNLQKSLDSQGQKGDTKFDGTFNITGFENVGRDIAAKAIVQGLIKQIMGQLDLGNPAEANLYRIFGTVLKQMDAGAAQNKP
jgi:hypothetical protein